MPDKLILLMNHESAIQVILQVCLSRLGGWRVISLALSQQSLESLALDTPDVILLDMPMLNAEFFAQIKNLKTHPLTRSSPILLFTSDAHWLSHQQFKELGVVGAITTPFNPLTLPKQISDFLDWD